MKLFSVELDTINGESVPRVELAYKFSELDTCDIKNIHGLISRCYVDVITIYITKQKLVRKNKGGR